jgi:antitoxin YefM
MLVFYNILINILINKNKRRMEDKEIKIIVSEVDETEYLLKSEANKQKLMQAIENVEQQVNLVEVNIEELV